MYNGLVKLNDGIFKVYKVIMMILLALMSIWVFLEVIFREAGVSVPWIEEFTIYAFSWLTYFGAANVLRNDGHLSVTVSRGQRLFKVSTIHKNVFNQAVFVRIENFSVAVFYHLKLFFKGNPPLKKSFNLTFIG